MRTIPITITITERRRLRQLQLSAEVSKRVSQRLEAVLLFTSGLTAVQVAADLGRSERTVRRWLHAYASGGVAALVPQRTGPVPRDHRALDEQGRALLAQTRTWTARQVQEALAEAGWVVGLRAVRASLQRLGARYKRTKHSLAHRQDPAAATVAREHLAGLKRGL
jgi:transposase